MTREEVAQSKEWLAEEKGTLLFPPLSHLAELLNIGHLSAPGGPGQSVQAEWRDLLNSTFGSPVARHFWHDKLEEERALIHCILQSLPGTTEKIRCYVRSPLAMELGCPSTLKRLERLLEQGLPEERLLEHPLVIQARLADAHAVLIRLAAWRVVDLSLVHWDTLQQTGHQERVLLQHFLPVHNTRTGHWSNPLAVHLDQLARLCGCPPEESPTLYLADLWQRSLREEAMPSGKQTLLEHWRAGLARPKKNTVSELLNVVVRTLLEREGKANASPLNIQCLTESFHFAEGCSYLRKALTRHALPNRVISDVFAIYQPEYHKARTILGHPLANSL